MQRLFTFRLLLFVFSCSPLPAQSLLSLLPRDSVVAQDDRVMGGVSQTMPRWDEQTLVFQGNLSRKSGGGFASMLSPAEPMDLALRRADGVKLRVLGDGRRYFLRFRQEGAEPGVWHRAKFFAPSGKMKDIALPWSTFQASWRGKPQSEEAPLGAYPLLEFGLLVSDGSEGPFALRVLSLKPLRIPWTKDRMRWRYRSLVFSAPDLGNAKLKAQLVEYQKQLSQARRHHILRIVSLSSGATKVGERNLNLREIQKFRASLDLPKTEFQGILIGKDGGVNLRWSEPLSLQTIWQRIASMPMAQEEARYRRKGPSF